MIVDASALIALLFDEPESDAIAEAVARNARPLLMSPFNYLEAAARIDVLGSAEKSAKFDILVETLGLQIADTTGDQAKLAREAYQRFGKGNHPAKPNLGDCFAYALAKALGEPMLFKGNDFRRTDIEAVL